MCGLFGAIIHRPLPPGALEAAIQRACAAQAHRGPNMLDQKVYQFGETVVVLAHQRLSILDLSENGRQPMLSHDRNCSIVFNGEIYNYKELGEKHQIVARTGTDTEIALEMLASFRTPAEVLPEFNGMWSIAMLDLKNGVLTLSRDRAGVKPLYYTIVDGNLFFASEIKTLLEFTERRFRLNRPAIAKYVIQSLQDDTNETFFEGIFHFPAGQFSQIDVTTETKELSFQSFWDPFLPSVEWNYDNPQDTFRTLFADAVRLRLRSDVPIGVMLSGGLDSSAITHSMTRSMNGQPFSVLSAVSPGHIEDESHFIGIMADAYGLKVDRLTLDWNPELTISLMEKATWHNDAPLGSLSNVAFYILMRQARQKNVTVLLSGQGADELLCGYRKFLGFYLEHLFRSGKFFTAAKTFAQFLLNGTVLKQFTFAEAGRYFRWGKAKAKSILSDALQLEWRPANLGAAGDSLPHRQWLDYRRFSVPFLTHYEDRLSMAFGLEIRLPFLDYRLVEFLLNAPDHLKLRRGWTKWLMRDVLKDEMPSEIVWRKDKQGFANPQGLWLKTTLKPEVTRLFSRDALMFKHSLIDYERLQEFYSRYCNGSRNIWYRDIFNPFALEIWLRQFDRYIEPQA